MSNKPIIVIDPGHGGKEKVGGSSPNNAVGANGLLEKNLTLDVANRVVKSLANQADVFMTRAGDTNIGLAARAKVAKDKNASLFLSIHFNGFEDSKVDGTEVWVAKEANSSSKKFAKTLLENVVDSTKVKNRGVREGDLGVLLPNRHSSVTSACLLEVSFLSNPTQAHELESDTYKQNIANSIISSVREYFSLSATSQSLFYDNQVALSLANGNKSLDEIAKEIGYSSHSDYVSKEVKPATLFGLSIEGGIHPAFYKKLQAAETMAKAVITPTPVTASDWGIKRISGYDARQGGNHPWGFAIDIDYAENPYIMHESGESALDKILEPVYHRISRFILSKDSIIPKEMFTGKQSVSDKYDLLLNESNAMKTYFKLMQDKALLQTELNNRHSSDASSWEKVWNVKGHIPTIDEVQEIMMKDYVVLAGKDGPIMSGKTYPSAVTIYKGIIYDLPKPKKGEKQVIPDVPFVNKNNSSPARKPENGFLTIRKEVVTALTNQHLRWGAIDFGTTSGDVMHFDYAQNAVYQFKKSSANSNSHSLNYSNANDYSQQFGGKSMTVSDVKWAADSDSPDYRHLGVPIDYTPFDFSASNLERLIEVNNFNVNSAAKNPRDEVIFGLRGCMLADGKESSGGFVNSVKLVEAIPDHQQCKCVIGVWKRSTKQIVVFPGSTVPYWEGMERQRKDPKHLDHCNMLSTGRYDFIIGNHHEAEPNDKLFIRGVFKEKGTIPALRTLDDLIYTVKDTWTFGSPGDNLHPTRHSKATDKFSSEGCITVVGTYNKETDKHGGLWSEFRQAAGLTKETAPDNEKNYAFVFMLLTGREARLINQAGWRDLTRLRFGSTGIDVETLQLELKNLPKKYYTGTQDGDLKAATAQAFINWQKDQDGTADGIVTPKTARKLGIDIINHLCLAPSKTAQISNSSVINIRELSKNEIDYYKNIDKTQKWVDSNGKKALNNLWKDDIIWELPEKGVGYINYNRNDSIGKPSDYNDTMYLDEIGTKETIEKIIEIGREWNKLHADQPLQIGDLSRPGGIDTPDHATHMNGKAFDMRPLRKTDGDGGFKYTDTAIYSQDLTKEFIRMVRNLYPATTFYFNDDVIYKAKEFSSFVSKQAGHNNHLHVMF
jgi:N-acetylmuramoyl-L-alanine amidase/peptidoglycan hydrolase-like protein with peptidoglycan-binding domain